MLYRIALLGLFRGDAINSFIDYYKVMPHNGSHAAVRDNTDLVSHTAVRDNTDPDVLTSKKVMMAMPKINYYKRL